MTTHWIIGIGSPKLPVMSGKAILTAVSSGTTEMPSPTSISRSHGQATTGAAAAVAAPFTAGATGSLPRRGLQIGPRGNALGCGCSAYRRGGAGGKLPSGDGGRKIFGAATLIRLTPREPGC